MRTVTLALIALGAVACVTAESFPEAAARTSCHRALECEGDDATTDLPTCLDDVEAFADCFAENCDSFDAEAADECLDALRGADCGGGADLQVCFFGVYTDCNLISLGLCTAGG